MIRNIDKILRIYVAVISLYLIGDGLFHIFDLKLMNASGWPQAPFVYASFMGHLWGLLAVFVGALGLEVQKDLIRYKRILYILAVWLLIFGLHLIYISLTVDFQTLFHDSPSVFVWMPFYNAYLIFEASLAFIFSLLIFLWHKNSKKI